jgi:secreted Zn-dependent insulinase-like peptidase
MAVSSARNVALIVFLRSLMGEPLFSELRTKKQLGYVVSLGTAAYGR